VTLPASLALLAWLLPGAAHAARVQWLGELPPQAQLEQTERSTGPATHLSVAELSWPVQVDALHGAEQAVLALRGVEAECLGRWEAFDVEKDIAWRLGEARSALQLLGGDADRADLHRALVLQGAAVFWAWSPAQRERLQEAEPYLMELAGERMLRPWVDAVALEPGWEPSRADFPDQGSYQAFSRQRERLLGQRSAELVVQGLPSGASLVVDGRVVDPGQPLELVAGEHRVHVDRGGVVSSAQLLRLAPGERTELTGLLPRVELDRAVERVLAGNLLDVPPAVKARVDADRALAGDEPYYLAAWSGRGSPEVVELSGDEPWRQGEFEGSRHLLLLGGLGAGLLGSTAFEESDGTTAHGAAATIVELGALMAWRRWAGVVELGVLDTGGRASVEFGDVATQTNTAASTFARLTVAPGFYALRLRPKRANLLVAVPIGLMSPAHSGVGAQVSLGVPLARTLWLRLGAELWKGSELPKWQEVDGVDDPLTSVSVRVGVAWKAH
jgi:hypothetical protein